jgi:hypothetical protein
MSIVPPFNFDRLKEFQNRPKTTIMTTPKRPNDLIELSAYGRDSTLFARHYITQLAPLLYIPRLCDQPDARIWFRHDSTFADVCISAAPPTDPLKIGAYGGFIDNNKQHHDSFSSCAPRDAKGRPWGGGGIRCWFISKADVAENARIRGISVPQPVAKYYVVPKPTVIEPDVIDLTTKRKRVPPKRDDFIVGVVGPSRVKHARPAEPIEHACHQHASHPDCDSSDTEDVVDPEAAGSHSAVETHVVALVPASSTYQPRKKESDRLSPTASCSEVADYYFKVYEDMLHEPDLRRAKYDVVRGVIYGEGGRTIFNDPKLTASQAQEAARIRKYCDDLLPRFYPDIKIGE